MANLRASPVVPAMTSASPRPVTCSRSRSGAPSAASTSRRFTVQSGNVTINTQATGAPGDERGPDGDAQPDERHLHDQLRWPDDRAASCLERHRRDRSRPRSRTSAASGAATLTVGSATAQGLSPSRSRGALAGPERRLPSRGRATGTDPQPRRRHPDAGSSRDERGPDRDGHSERTATFSLTFNGATATGIAFNASAGTVDNALESLVAGNSNDFNVTRSDQRHRHVSRSPSREAGGHECQPDHRSGNGRRCDPADRRQQPLPAGYDGRTIRSRRSRTPSGSRTPPRRSTRRRRSSAPPTGRRARGCRRTGSTALPPSVVSDTYYAGRPAGGRRRLSQADAARNAQPVIILLSDGDANSR